MTPRYRNLLLALIASAALAEGILIARLYGEKERAVLRVAELEKQLDRARSAPALPPPEAQEPRAPAAAQPTAPPVDHRPAILEPSPLPSASPAPALSGSQAFFVESRVAAIGKFVPLDEDQRERLRRRYEQSALGQQPAESLEDIIGKSNADFYRAEVHKAFEAGQNEEMEKEILLMVRKFSLRPEQEDELRRIFPDIESQIKDTLAGEPVDATPRGRLKRLTSEQELRDKLLASAMEKLLDREQYDAFLKDRAGSANRDLGVWHGP